MTTPPINENSHPTGQTTEPDQFQNPKDISEEQSQWLPKILAENPQILDLRERILPWTGGYSFSNIVHSDTSTVLSHLNRHKVLELIYQHLMAIGMHQTADILKEECGHEFQLIDQNWDKTDLLILVSLGILPREDPWKIQPDPHHQFIKEEVEEDFFSSQYTEDPRLIYKELQDPNYNVVYHEDTENPSIKNVQLASLRRLILIALSTVSEDEINQFFLSLHLVTSPHHFLEHLVYLFDFEPPSDVEFNYTAEMKSQNRRNIINLVKKWINYHGFFIGSNTIKLITRFQSRILKDNSEEISTFHHYSRTMLQPLNKLHTGLPLDQTKVVPPIIPDPQILFHPNLKITDPHPTEVARQITLVYHTSFKAIYSREFIIGARDHSTSHQTPTLTEFAHFGKRLTVLFLEQIVTAYGSNDKPSVNDVISAIIEIGKALQGLYNYEGLACIVRALRRKDILSLPYFQQHDNRATLEKLYEHSGEEPTSFKNYLKEVNNNFVNRTPCIPNIRAELNMNLIGYFSNNPSAIALYTPYLSTQNKEYQSSCSSDNSSSRYNLSLVNGLINWEQIWSDSVRTAVWYRFQYQLRYHFYSIPQITKVIEKGPLFSEKQINEGLEAIWMGTNSV